MGHTPSACGNLRARGFTLIELLVVISIISLLAVILTASLMTARQKARDTRRLTDIKTIANALEFYNMDEGHYPIATEWATGCGHAGSSWIPDGDNYDWSTEYLPDMPRDPSENCSALNQHTYAYWSDGSNYQITTQLESSVPPDTGGNNYSFDGTSFQPFIDTAPFTAAFSSLAPDPTNQSPIPIVVSFARSVVDFTQSSVSVVRGFVSGFSPVLATLYNIFVTPTDNDSIIVSLSGGAVHDESGVGNAPAQFTITFNSLLPHPALSPDPFPMTVSAPFSVDVNFTLPVVDFSAGDINVQNGTVDNFYETAPMDGTNYTLTITPTSAGEVAVYIPSDVAHSAAGNGNVASNTISTDFNP